MDKYNGTIVSSRIRLARNIKNFQFPNILNVNKSKDLLKLVFNAVEEVGNFNCYETSKLSKEVLEEYLEDHIISKELIENDDISALCVSHDNIVSIMVNEEDHLREQCILKGLNLKKAYDILNDIDNELANQIPFSFSQKLGYLTACPSNVGTGLRASVMLFLPALTITNNMSDIITTVGKLGICVRGAYGEGSDARGYLYQVSNQISLGKTEKEIIQLVESTVLKICDLEEKSRKNLLAANEIALRDDTLRSYGILTNCYSITSAEAIELLSKIKLGMGLQLINLKEPQIIDELLEQISPVKLKKLNNKNFNHENRDIFRAEYLNRVLKNLKI